MNRALILLTLTASGLCLTAAIYLEFGLAGALAATSGVLLVLAFFFGSGVGEGEQRG